MDHKSHSIDRPAGGAWGRNLNKFRRDESGAMIVFSLFLFIMMLIVSGMAVDFMRFESRRSMLQGATDRCSLAAANLDKTTNPAAIATDCLTKAGYAQYMIGAPIVSGDANYRSVEINAQLPINTYFLKLIGIKKLVAPGDSRAVEGVGNVEVSLALDISGSMRDPTYNANGTSTGKSKIEALRTAATSFVNTVLADEYEDKISVSLIPYSQQVNAGPTLFNRLNTNHRHNFSHCIEFPDDELSKVALDTSLIYEQGQHFQTNADSNGSKDVTQPICPRYWFERITHITQDRVALATQISQFEPRAGTSIFLGLKWAVALLDPSTRTLVAPGLDAGLAGRPFDYSSANSPNPTQKVIVLMTDGRNDWSNYLKPYAYDSPSDYYHWSQYNYPYWRSTEMRSTSEVNYNKWMYNRYHRADQSLTEYAAWNYPNFDGTLGDDLMTNLCTAAKAKGIVIFAIAFEAPPDGQTQMSNCASSVNHYFKASGGEIVAIFEAIAAQITYLRLTL